MEAHLRMLVTAKSPMAEQDAYLQKMTAILARSPPGLRNLRGPARLLDHLFLGNMREAHDHILLKRLRITHILNCAGTKDYSREMKDNPYDPDESGVRAYMQFEALDTTSYPIMRHFQAARAFINEAKREGGRVLVHCEMGVNRSGALCLAYVMEYEDLTLLEALRQIKMDRPVLLCNEGFRRQLFHFARERGMLHKGPSKDKEENGK